MQYRQLHQPGRYDPLEVTGRVARAAAEAGHDYLVYERDGVWDIAIDPLLDVSIDRRRITTRVDGHTTSQPLGPCPLPQLRRELITRSPVGGATAYGWIGFEFAYLTDPGSALTLATTAGDRVLARMMVPRTRIRVDAHTVIIASATMTDLIHVADLLHGPPRIPGTTAPASVVVVPVDESVGGRQAFEDTVGKVLDHHVDGRAIARVVLSRTVTVPHPVDFLATYLRGRAAHPGPRSFLLHHGGVSAAGFAADVLIDVRDGRIGTCPLAGIRARTSRTGVDRLQVTDLITDPGDLYAHAVAVTAARDDVQALCTPGTVTARAIIDTVTRGAVHQLGTRLDGTLRIDRNAFDALHALFPATAASGVSRDGACRVIGEHEPRRGLYSGAVLTTDLASGDLDAAVVAHGVFAGTDEPAVVRAGAGVTACSIPARAYQETTALLRTTAPHVVAAHSAATAQAGTR